MICAYLDHLGRGPKQSNRRLYVMSHSNIASYIHRLWKVVLGVDFGRKLSSYYLDLQCSHDSRPRSLVLEFRGIGTRSRT